MLLFINISKGIEMKNIKKINPILVTFLLYSTRILYFGAEFKDAPILAIMALAYFGLKYIEIRKEVITENNFRLQVNQDITSIKSTLSSLSMQKSGNPFGSR